MYTSYLYQPSSYLSKEFIVVINFNNQSMFPEESSDEFIKSNLSFTTKDSLVKQDETSHDDNYYTKAIKPKIKIVRHGKYSNDNMIKKTKTKIIKIVIHFLNNMIVKIYGNGEKKLYMIDPKETEDATIEFNRLYINKTLKEILSVKISKKYTAVKDKLNNIKIIEELLNLDGKNKRRPFEKILNFKFKDIAKYLGGEIDDVEELAGLKSTKIWRKFLDEEEKCIKKMKSIWINLESFLNDLHPRKRHLNKIKEI